MGLGRSTCPLSVKISLLCWMSVKIFDICRLSVNLGWSLTKQVNYTYSLFNSHSLNSIQGKKLLHLSSIHHLIAMDLNKVSFV